MTEDVEFVLGCVMGCELDAARIESFSTDVKPIVVLEYCPADYLESGKVNTSERMLDLAAMCFRPVAIVKSDLYDPLTASLWAREGLSDAMRSELADQSDAIFVAALNQVAADRTEVPHE